MKKKVFISLIIAACFFILCVVGFFLFRTTIYNYFLGSIQNRIHSKYQCRLVVGELTPDGLLGVDLSEITLVPDTKDTLFFAKKVKVSIEFMPIVSGKLRIASLTVLDGKLNVIGTSGRNNFAFLLKHKSETKEVVAERNYAKLTNKLIASVFSYLPSKIEVENFQIAYADEAGSFHMDLPYFKCIDEKVEGELVVHQHNSRDKWIVNGVLQKRKETFLGKIYGDSTTVVLPYLKDKFNLQCRFDTLFVSLQDKDYDDDSLTLNGKAYFYNLYLKHPKLDSNAIGLRFVETDYNFNFGKSSVAINFPKVLINKIQLSIASGFEKSGEGNYFLNTKMDKISAQDFFNSLPEGLFESFQGIQCEGNLQYKLDFGIDLAKPDCVVFDSKLKADDFRIKKFGITDFGKMNGPFVYTAYEMSKPFKSFVVGPANNDFTPLDQISPYLRSAVLQSEDGSFFWHNGFREDAFRMAIADNVKKGKFARGGSTISMQLVKNVFLSRKKTVARKLEEALIVWLIESRRITSKDRMYEVYLNVIEWGPGVYGIAEASMYYFNKRPSELSIEESIYLASIIPRPKGFKWSFDINGNLKSHLAYYFKRMGELLKRREVITQEQQSLLQANVKLTGPARRLVVIDSIAGDSIEVEEEF